MKPLVLGWRKRREASGGIADRRRFEKKQKYIGKSFFSKHAMVNEEDMAWGFRRPPGAWMRVRILSKTAKWESRSIAELFRQLGERVSLTSTLSMFDVGHTL